MTRYCPAGTGLDDVPTALIWMESLLLPSPLSVDELAPEALRSAQVGSDVAVVLELGELTKDTLQETARRSVKAFVGADVK